MDIITRKQLSILIQLAEVDKNFDSEEKELIYKIAKLKNFPEDSVEELMLNPEPIGSYGALSDNQKFEYLYSCIELMIIDKKIFDSEIIFCIDIAIKLGFKKDVVQFLKEEFDNYSKEEIRPIIFERYT
ncbi:TerB family tellurite resistance protein [Fulvivirga sediminis]|uniref:TerB family tellurite resistance protein n=1 Tax=Fulvivirga sediminis TaxID=2803949 RepID=A0A937JZ83_9BACT|nr:TerB family tellurite resistance protein [Fulvivirga sediminis]MBL3656409.1 TerB family tellurite resistance protein [Fulvivirga sediminis]